MLAVLLFAVPLALAPLAALARPAARPWLVVLGATAHLALTCAALASDDVSAFAGWLELDALGRLVLLVVAVLAFACALYVPGYLRERRARPTRTFCAALLFALATMTLVVESQHLGLMWVALEAATLACAPLVYFDRSALSLEATWKYIVIGAVGIALALLGSFFLAYSAVSVGRDTSLLFGDLVHQAPQLARPWLHAAFVMLFVGYGTKMGLAPMHSWKPDAYGEAPGIVGALLASAVMPCAFLALLRFVHISDAAGAAEHAHAHALMIRIGLVSMAVGP